MKNILYMNLKEKNIMPKNQLTSGCFVMFLQLVLHVFPRVIMVYLMLLCVPFLASAEDISVLYKEKCAVCHGENGDGVSIAAHSMRVKPTNFVAGNYKYRTTLWGEFPADTDIERSIRYGLMGTSMPVWDDLLSDKQISGMVQYIKSLSKRKFIKSKQVVVPQFNLNDVNIENGKKLYNEVGCIKCHGINLDGREYLISRIKNNISEGVTARDLTDYRNYRWGSSLTDLYIRIYTGLNGSEMQGYDMRLSENEIKDISAYISVIFNEKEKKRWLRPVEQTVEERGDYLLSIGTCELCHTSMSLDASFIKELAYAGGTKVISPQDGVFYSRNITSDMESGLGKWSVEEIKRAIRLGESRDGGMLYAFSMPWIFYYTMKDSDAEAIALALKRIPPVYNKIPSNEPAGLWQSFISKSQVILGIIDRTLGFAHNSYGVRDRKKGKSIPDQSDKRHWSILPPMGFVPAEKVVGVAGFDLPIPATTGSEVEDAKLKIGRYLVSIGPCSLCHTPTSGKFILKGAARLSGGIRVSLNHFGTIYTGNLTSDLETGLGRWSDREIRRALKSGIKKDGSMMHFQAMPWSIFSNITEADTEAMIAYLRTLPPVYKRMPKATSTNLVDYTISDHDFGIQEKRHDE